MRIIPKLYLSFGTILAIALISAAVSNWTAREAAFYLERTNFSHRQYEGYLSLSNHTYQLFKQFGDAMLIGDRDQGAAESRLLAEIREDIAVLRRLIGQEIQLAGEEEVEELDRLAAIERQIEVLLAEYTRLLRSGDAAAFPHDWSRLSHVLDERVDNDFNELIEEALADEAGEVVEVRELTAARVEILQNVARLFGLFAILAAAISLFLLIRDIRRPIEKLLAGAKALAGGDLQHRIGTRGKSELEDLGRVFNAMADELATREGALSESNARLEKAVADRTVELEGVLEQIQANEDNRKRLLADVSHELRTPLTIIRGEADIALRGGIKPPDIYREALERTREAAMHTAGIVDDLLFVARHESGETRLKLATVDLASLLPKIAEQHGSLATQNGATMYLSTEVAEASVRCDARRIRQVLLILLENAVRYGGRSIEMRLDPAPGGFAISVTDDGPGLTEDERERAFERFFRGSNAANRYDQGIGLGLPMAKAIVEAHGGEIALKSAPGEGLTASFTLPRRAKLEAVS